MQGLLISVLMKRIKAIRHFMQDKKVPIHKKLVIIFGVVYLLSPIDLIPAPVLGFAILDDLTLWGFIIYYLKDELDKYWKEETEPAEEKFKNKTIIDGAVWEEASEKTNEVKSDAANNK